MLKDGSVLRAMLPGRPTLDCLFSKVLLDNAILARYSLTAVYLAHSILQAWGRVRAICRILCHQEHAYALAV